jgi:hypothetical protein
MPIGVRIVAGSNPTAPTKQNILEIIEEFGSFMTQPGASCRRRNIGFLTYI